MKRALLVAALVLAVAFATLVTSHAASTESICVRAGTSGTLPSRDTPTICVPVL